MELSASAKQDRREDRSPAHWVPLMKRNAAALDCSLTPFAQQPTQMLLRQRDEEVQTLSAGGADQSLATTISLAARMGGSFGRAGRRETANPGRSKPRNQRRIEFLRSTPIIPEGLLDVWIRTSPARNLRSSSAGNRLRSPRDNRPQRKRRERSRNDVTAQTHRADQKTTSSGCHACTPLF